MIRKFCVVIFMLCLILSNISITVSAEDPPVISVSELQAVVQTSTYTVTGSVDKAADVWVNEEYVILNQDLTFSKEVNLQQGVNNILVEAEDGVGVAEPITVTVNYIPIIDYEYDNALFGEGGYITGMVIHPEEDVIYIRTDVGGAYRLNEPNMEWIPLNDDLPYSLETWYMVDGIAVDPQDPDTVYIAVGKGMSTTYQYIKGTILKSVDRGNTWSKLDIDLYFSGNGDMRYAGERIAVDPFNSYNIICGSRREGVWRSQDGGMTWGEVVFPGTLLEEYGVTAILFDKYTSGVVYAAAYGDGIYKSTDNGTNWTKLAGQDNPAQPMRMVTLPNGDLIVTADDNEKGVLKYSSGVWLNLTPDNNVTGTNGEPAGYCGISVSEYNTNHIVTSPCYVLGKMFFSDDGGVNWRLIDYNNSILNFAVPWMSKSSWAAAIASIEFDPYHENRVWFTDWHCIWKTDDITQTTVEWDNIQKGHEQLSTMSVRSIPVGAKLAIGGADATGGITSYYDEYPSKLVLGMSEIFDWDFCESDPGEIVLVGGSKIAGTGAISTDAGDNWTRFSSYPDIGNLVNKVAVSATNPSLFLVTTSQYSVFRTADGGSTWTEILDLPVCPKGPWTWAHVLKSDRINGNKFYFIDYKTGDFYVSTNGGINFTKTVTLPLPEDNRWIYIQPSFTDEGEIWVSLDDMGLYKSVDSGNTFVKIDCVDRAFNIALGKPAVGNNRPTVFMYGEIGEVEGLFRSVDDGNTWQDVDTGDTGFGNRPETMDGSRSTFGLVFVGTAGRGVRYGKEEATDVIPPKIILEEENSIVNQSLFTLRGAVNEQAEIKVNDVIVTLEPDLSFEKQLTLTEGSNRIEVEATDLSGNSGFKVTNITYDSTNPLLTLDQTNTTVRLADFTISGQISEPGTVYVAGNPVSLNEDYSFSTVVTLISGTNNIYVYAEDFAGNLSQTQQLDIEYVPITGFDIVVTEVGVYEENYVEGDQVHLYATVKNQGNSATPTEWIMVHFVKDHDMAVEKGGTIKWYPDDGIYSCTALSIGSRNMNISIEPGESVTYVSTGTFEIQQGESYFKLLAIADASCKFTATEEIRDNNYMSSMVSSAAITSFSVETQIGFATIDRQNNTITFDINEQSRVDNILPDMSIMAGSSISPDIGTYINLTQPVEYIVTTAIGKTHTWTVSCNRVEQYPQEYFDLEITEIGVDKADYLPGDEVRFYAVIENKGNIPSPQNWVNTHFVLLQTTAKEKADKKWYPGGGNLSSTALKVANKNVNCSILPGPENSIIIYSDDTYTITDRRQSFNLLAITDAAGKFYDTELIRKNNYLSEYIESTAFDLVITGVGIVDGYVEGEPVYLYADVKNQGNSATPMNYIMVHFVEGHNWAVEKGDPIKWYPSNGTQSSTALSIGSCNKNISITPGETIRYVSTNTYEIPLNTTDFTLLAIADASCKFTDDEIRNNNYSYIDYD